MRQPERFASGTRGLEVVLAARTTLLGRVLVDEELGPLVRAVSVEVAPAGATFQRQSMFLEQDGRFSHADPPRPTCVVRVRAPWSDEIVLTEEVDVSGASGDPTVEFDLRGKLRAVRMTGRGADGAPVAFSLRERGTNPPSAVHESPQHLLLLHRWPVDLVAGARGYRDVDLHGVDGPREVEFTEPGLRVVLRWRSMPDLGPDIRLRPRVLPAELFDREVPHVAYAARDELFGEGGEARVSVPAAGPHVVLLHVERVTERGRMSSSFYEEVPVVEVMDSGAEQVFEIAFPADTVRKRADALRY